MAKGNGGLGGELDELDLIFQLGSRKCDSGKLKRRFFIVDDGIFLILRRKKHLSRLDRLTVEGAAAVEYKMNGVAVDLSLVGVVLLPGLGVAEGGHVKGRGRIVRIEDAVGIIAAIAGIHRQGCERALG